MMKQALKNILPDFLINFLKSRLNIPRQIAQNLLRPYKGSFIFFKTTINYFHFFSDFIKFRKADSGHNTRLTNLFPILSENTSVQNFDSHYFYQDIWAFKKIAQTRPVQHTDIGSRLDLIGFLTAVTKVVYIDIRPMHAELENYESKAGSILNLPFEDNSIESLSCLHVVEHIGLGRYGDPLDPDGSMKACLELKRVLAKGGSLYFSVPVGIPQTCFNAHRIHSPDAILTYFEGLKLIELSGITDEGKPIYPIDKSKLAASRYACGLFHFTK